MNLPVAPPVLPMLAKRVAALRPTAAAGSSSRSGTASARWSSATATRSSIQSRDEKPLEPLLPRARASRCKAQLPTRCVLDGEVVIARGQALDFEALQMRIHPAASRVKLLAAEIPASIVFFDLLCDGDRDLRGAPFRERRALLEDAAARARRRPSTSRPRRPTGRPPPTGSSASRAPGSTA